MRALFFILKGRALLKKAVIIIRYYFVLVPFFIWGISYQWHGNSQLTEADYWLYLLTETGSVPYALITCVLFALLFCVFIQKSKTMDITV